MQNKKKKLALLQEEKDKKRLADLKKRLKSIDEAIEMRIDLDIIYDKKNGVIKSNKNNSFGIEKDREKRDTILKEIKELEKNLKLK
jgi:hypothetical protein